jgi:peptide/nickel transport system substrate-binding protein
MKSLLIPLVIMLVVIFVVTGCSNPSPTPTTPATIAPAATSPITQAPTTIPTTTKPVATTTATTTTVPAITTSAPAAKQQYGGALKILIPPVFLNIGYPPRAVPGFNPFQVAGTIETLLQADEQGNPIPNLASSWKISDDRLSLTLNLRQGIKFHDGTVLDAKAAKWCMETLSKEQPAELNTMKSIDVIDDYTVKVNFKNLDNLMVNYFLLKPGNMISPTAVQKNGADWAMINPVGTGPFKFTGYQRDVYLRMLEKNTDYWQTGKPYVNSIEVIFIADAMTRKTAFQSGAGQVITGLTPRDANELSKTGLYKILTSPSSIFSLMLDSVNPDTPFYNVKVRQAFAYAIDKKAICDTFGYGYLNPSNQIGYPGSPMYNPDIKGYPYDVAKAKALLAEAGYPNGFKTTINYSTGAYDDVYLAIQSYLAKVGIEAQLNKAETAKIQDLSSNGWKNGTVTNSPYMAVGYPNAKTIAFYYSPRSPFGKSVLRPDEVETLYQAAVSAPTKEEMVKNTQEINRLLIDKYCVEVPIFVSPNIGAKDPSLRDDKIFDPWQEMWRPADAWLEKK